MPVGNDFAESGCGTTKKFGYFHIGEALTSTTSVRDICQLQATLAPINRDTAKSLHVTQAWVWVCAMGDQTNKPKSPAPRNSHENAEFSTGTRSADRVRYRPLYSAACESPETRIPLAPNQGRGRYPAHEKGRACLPLQVGGLEPSGSAGSIPSKAMPSQLPEFVNQTNKHQKPS